MEVANGEHCFHSWIYIPLPQNCPWTYVYTSRILVYSALKVSLTHPPPTQNLESQCLGPCSHFPPINGDMKTINQSMLLILQLYTWLTFFMLNAKSDTNQKQNRWSIYGVSVNQVPITALDTTMWINNASVHFKNWQDRTHGIRGLRAENNIKNLHNFKQYHDLRFPIRKVIYHWQNTYHFQRHTSLLL